MTKKVKSKVKKQDSVRTQALRYVNDVRRACGMKPLKNLPKGEPHNPEMCVLARALPPRFSPSVTGSEITLYLNNAKDNYLATKSACAMDGAVLSADSCELTFEAPKVIGKFVHNFDMGKYPDLEVHSSLDLSPF